MHRFGLIGCASKEIFRSNIVLNAVGLNLNKAISGVRSTILIVVVFVASFKNVNKHKLHDLIMTGSQTNSYGWITNRVNGNN